MFFPKRASDLVEKLKSDLDYDFIIVLGIKEYNNEVTVFQCVRGEIDKVIALSAIKDLAEDVAEGK